MVKAHTLWMCCSPSRKASKFITAKFHLTRFYFAKRLKIGRHFGCLLSHPWHWGQAISLWGSRGASITLSHAALGNGLIGSSHTFQHAGAKPLSGTAVPS